MQKIFEQDQSAKVKRCADDNEDNCKPIWRRYEDLREFHGDVLFK
jgi:hypothetical protein